MVTLDNLQREKRIAILRLAEDCGARNVRVFGSVVHGENRDDGDIDFLVDLDPGRNLFDLGRLLMNLTALLGVPVDIVEAGCLLPYVRDRVLSEAVPL